MRRYAMVFVIGVLCLTQGIALAQMGRGMGPRGMHRMYDPDYGNVPQKLPKPENEQWLGQLATALELEKQSRAQYEGDGEKYGTYMPYAMIVPQEDNHISWIEAMFAAYGVKPELKELPVRETTSLNEAYEVSMGMEQRLMDLYRQLIDTAGDKDSARILETIFYETRWHYHVFSRGSQCPRGGPGLGRRQ